VITAGGDLVHILLGDVAGKGVAAALLMSHLSALFRTLIAVGLPMTDLMQRANRMFCESTQPSRYATLVCARADASGHIEVSNAGHPPPLVVRASDVSRIEATGVPIGMFASSHYPSHAIGLERGEALLLYSDGIIESRDGHNDEYGVDRLAAAAAAAADSPPRDLIAACLHDVAAFRGLSRQNDDVTMMAIRRT
jgi:sigma-B regulation protein RsbU (phosphoserine phosphatase)